MITGRPYFEKHLTELWIEKFFKDNPPEELYHANRHHSQAAQYKCHVLKNHPEITLFLEDEPWTLKYLRDNLAIKIIDLPELISEIVGRIGKTVAVNPVTVNIAV